jgi:chaperonin GroEL
MQMVPDMLESGIVDPVLVLKQAISNAASVATSIITTEVVICDQPKEEKAEGAGAGMNGMDY